MRILISSGSVLQVLADGPSRSLGVAVGPASTRLSAPGLVQTAQRFRARSARNMDRGNVATRISWRSAYAFSTAAESDRFFLTHARTLLRSGTLALLEEGNARATLFASAVIQEPSLEQMGTTVVVDYSAIAGPSLDVSGYWAAPLGSALDAVVGTDGAYAANACKLFNGSSDSLAGPTVAIDQQDFRMSLSMAVDAAWSQATYKSYFGRWSADSVDFAGNVSIHQGPGSYFYPLARAHDGTTYLSGVNFAPGATCKNGLSHTYVIERIGTTLRASFDGTVISSVAIPASASFLNSRQIGCGAAGPFLAMSASLEIAGSKVVDYGYAAGPALVEWDRSGNDNHGTYTSSSITTMASSSALARPHNILDGFSLYTHATLGALRVPYDVDGNPLSITPPTGYTLASEHPGGFPHNGAESSVVIGANTYTLAQLQALGGYSALPIRNIYKLAAVQADTVADYLSASGADGVYFL